MDTKEVKDPKEAKDLKEVKDSETKKDAKKGYWYYSVIVLVILIVLVAVGGYYFNLNNLKQNEISELQKQIGELTNNNKDLNLQITGFSSKVDSLKSFSEKIMQGNVPFWDENGEGIVVAMVPLNSYSARKLSEGIVLEDLGNASANNLVFKNITRNGKNWTSLFVCKDNLNDSSCGATVAIDEIKKSYSLGSSGF